MLIFWPFIFWLFHACMTLQNRMQFRGLGLATSTNSSRWRAFIHVASTGGPKSRCITQFECTRPTSANWSVFGWRLFFYGRLSFGLAPSVASKYSTPVGDPRPTISTNNSDWCETCACPLQAIQEQGVLGLDDRTRTKNMN